MSIAINTNPANSISDLAQLVTEIRDELDDDSYAVDKIYRAIARGESVFNRELRSPYMETEYEFTVSSEYADLPTDFLQMRHIYQEGSPDSPLLGMSPAGLRNLYQGRSGIPCAYAIENRRIAIAPVGAAVFKMLYYAAIPALTDSTPTNWLLANHPDLYLHQTLANLFNKTGDSERAALNLSIARSIMESISDSNKKARWGGGPLVPTGLVQVYGARI